MYQLFILVNPWICDNEIITNIVAKHHNDTSVIEEGMRISPSQVVTHKLINDATVNYEMNDFFCLEVGILRKADSLSVSSDRASEINGD